MIFASLCKVNGLECESLSTRGYHYVKYNFGFVLRLVYYQAVVLLLRYEKKYKRIFHSCFFSYLHFLRWKCLTCAWECIILIGEVSSVKRIRRAARRSVMVPSCSGKQASGARTSEDWGNRFAGLWPGCRLKSK